MSLYRKILHQAWGATWRFKYLWFFGLFAALLGNAGEYEILLKGFSNDSEQGILRTFSDAGLLSVHGLANIVKLFKEEPLAMTSVLLFGIFILVIFIFIVWLINVSQAALVNNTALIISNKKSGFQEGIDAGVKNFWPVLGYNAILKSSIYLIFGLISFVVISSVSDSNTFFTNIVYGILFVFFIPIAIAFSFIVKYSIAYKVIQNKNFVDSIISGFDLFRKNWLISLEMAFLLYFINIVSGFIVILIFFIMAVPFLLLAFLFNQLLSLAGFWLVMITGFVVFFGFLVTFGSALSTFQISAWTTLFIELISKGGQSKIVRVFSKE